MPQLAQSVTSGADCKTHLEAIPYKYALNTPRSGIGLASVADFCASVTQVHGTRDCRRSHRESLTVRGKRQTLDWAKGNGLPRLEFLRKRARRADVSKTKDA